MNNNGIQWNQTAGLLASTLKDLQCLYARVCFADLGKLPEWIGQDDIGAETRLERREVPEKELFFDGLLGIYHGLNYAWATRHIDLENAESEGGVSFRVCLPTDGVFARLVPADLPSQVETSRIGDGVVSLPLVRIGLHMAVRKLTCLCYLLSRLPDVQAEVERPKGLVAAVEAKPMTEADLERWLAIIYGWLNETWNGRFDVDGAGDHDQTHDEIEYPLELISHI